MNQPQPQPQLTYKQMLAEQEAKLDRTTQLATSLIEAYLPGGEWSFRFNTRVHALGVCAYHSRTIQLSRQWTLATPWEEVSDTVRHEIAHAIAGHRAGHGAEWQEAALRVGAKPETYYNGNLQARDVHVATYEMIDTTTGKILKSYFRKPPVRTYKKLPRLYMQGRKAETKGKITITPVCMIKELDL